MAEKPNAVPDLVWTRDPNTGSLTLQPSGSINLEEQPVYAKSGDWPAVKYGGMGSALRTYGRELGQNLSLGFYGAATDRYRTPEERETIKSEKEFNPWASFLGAVSAYAVPFLGEVKALEGAAKLAGVVPNMGAHIAKGMFQAESKAFQRVFTDSLLTGVTQGVTEGMDNASLDDFSQESIEHGSMDALLGGVMGAGWGVVLGKLNPLTNSAQRVLSRAKGETPKGSPLEIMNPE